MRSELVYTAGIKIPNRFLLASVAIKAVHRLHVATTRTEETANRVFSEVAHGRYTEVKMPLIKAEPPIDPLLISPAA